MTLGGPLYFIEPQIVTKRQGVIEKRFGKSTKTLEEILDKLIEVRKNSVKTISNNLRTFKKSVNENRQLTLNIVKTPSQAVKFIIKQCKKTGLKRIDLNKSNTLRVLEPELVHNGFELVHTYNFATSSGNLGIFNNLELGNYWTLRELELENTFQSFNLNRNPMAYSRGLITKATDKKDFIGLLGANVFTATGEIFSVQHLYNITSILIHAKQSFLILTLDKLVSNYEDALFQARCTAMYGLEQIILDLFDEERGQNKSKFRKLKKEKQKKQNDVDNNYQIYKPPKNLHIIILDDSRLNMLGSKHEDLLYCIGCRKCGLHCPRVRAGHQEPLVKKITARELLMDGYLYGPKTAIESGLFDCTLCKSCTTMCPLGIELTDHLLDLRERCQKSDLFSEPHKRIRNNILEVGNAYGSDYTYKTTKNIKTGGQK